MVRTLAGAFVSTTTVALALGALACSNSGNGNMTLSLSTSRASGAVAAPALVAAGDTTVLALGNDTLILRSLDVVLRKVELKHVEASACDSNEGNGDCEEFETGPVLASFPLGTASAAALVTVNAPEGQYDRLEFEIHKTDSTSGADATFLAANPGFKGISIKVTGTFSQSGSRSDFTFTSDLDAEQEIGLSPPLTVAASSGTNLTIRLDVSTWFVNDGALLDPASANQGGPMEGVVQDNIKRSIEAFRDDDHDGHDDDHEGT